MHVMLDIETFGVLPTSVIVSIGAVAFDPGAKTLGPLFYRNIDSQDCERLGLTTDEDTLDFWRQVENAEALAKLKDNRVSLAEAMHDFMTFFVKVKADQLWSLGWFDVVIVENAIRAIGCDTTPWNFRDVRELRTACDLMDVNYRINRDPVEYPLHDALHDARWQARVVQELMAKKRSNAR